MEQGDDELFVAWRGASYDTPLDKHILKQRFQPRVCILERMDQDEAIFALVKILAEPLRLRVLGILTGVSYLSRREWDWSLRR